MSFTQFVQKKKNEELIIICLSVAFWFLKRMNEVRGGQVAGLDGHGDEAPGRRGQAPHVYDVRPPDHPRKVLSALRARGTCTHESNLFIFRVSQQVVFFAARANPAERETFV